MIFTKFNLKKNKVKKMDYNYGPLRENQANMHNRCLGGRAWCVQDICGIICAVLTWMLILYAEFVVMAVILLPNPYPVYSTINMVIFNSLAFLAFSSHLRTMFSDPVGIFCFRWVNLLNSILI